jgi:hypothetical protein
MTVKNPPLFLAKPKVGFVKPRKKGKKMPSFVLAKDATSPHPLFFV